jgi:hypothetical protein
MHWVNRPTTQQLAMFGAHAAQDAVRGAPACAASSAFRGAVGARPRGRGVAITLRRRGAAPAIERTSACGTIRRFALVRPAFGPRNPLRVSIALDRRRTATLEVRRGPRVVRRIRFTGRERVLRVRPRGLRAGALRLVLRSGGASAVLGARKR